MTDLQETKRFTDECYRRAIKNGARAVINHVKKNGYDNALIFTAYSAGDEFEQVGLKGEHYFITLMATYGRNWDGSYNTKHQETYEVSKEEGNEIFKRVKVSKRFD